MVGAESCGMKVLVSAVSAKLGGAATYVRNLAASLRDLADQNDRFVFVVPPERAREMPAADERFRVHESQAASGSYARRWWWDQISLRRLIRRERPDVLFSSANFAMLACPCPQALLVRIPIYFSREYLEHVLPGKSPAFRAETALRRWLVCRSVASADCVVTPSAAMLEDLARFARIPDGRARVIPYGVPRERLAPDSPRPATPGSPRPLRVLWVSHYADHKDLATLLRAVRLLRRNGNLAIELRLTLDPPGGSTLRGQHTSMPLAEQGLLAGLGDSVRCLGVLSYEQIWQAYSEADVFVFPSLCESFGHPLVEAMAAGLPVVASGIAVHREICGDAAEYFPVGNAEVLAQHLAALAADPRLRAELARRGAQRVRGFLWENHVTGLLALLRELSAAPAAPLSVAAGAA
jgi:glycosyltransferase involved in cell wall biosynthesis